MDEAHALLIDATGKLIALRQSSDWARELPERCPPVIWFGDATSPKPKILTLGANPSRQEFLSDNAPTASMKVHQAGDHSLLAYLEPPHNRFRLLRSDERLADVLASASLREEIIASYNNYFKREPYQGWFGHDRDTSYKVEGFLRGLSASYYGAAARQAIHIDLFPFATLSNFGRIKAIAVASLFADGWAQRFVTRLAACLRPDAVVVFGGSNFRHFRESIAGVHGKPTWQVYKSGKYFLTTWEPLGIPVVGLTTNLGNPRGFNATELRDFGARVQDRLGEGLLAE